MVIVNFDVAISNGVQNNEGVINDLIGQLQGRASATFVVLAGIGLGLPSFKNESDSQYHCEESNIPSTSGLLNMLIFVGDILH